MLCLPCQPRVQFRQHPSSTWTTFWRPLLHYIPAPPAVLAKFFYIDIFSTHYFLYLSYSTPSSWLWGKPCTVSSTFRSPSLLEPVPIQPSGFSTFHPKMKTKGDVFHIKLSSFADMHTPRHSVLKQPWQFPCPVLAGLKIPVYKVKFVIRKFLPGGNYHQETIIISCSSNHTMPHHRWRISIELSPLHF